LSKLLLIRSKTFTMSESMFLPDTVVFLVFLKGILYYLWQFLVYKLFYFIPFVVENSVYAKVKV